MYESVHALRLKNICGCDESHKKGKDDTARGVLVGVLSSCVAAYGFGSKTGDGSLYKASFYRR